MTYRKYIKDLLEKDIKNVHTGAWRVIVSTYPTATVNTRVLIINSEIKTERFELATL